MRIAERIVLSREERSTMETWEKGRSLPPRLVQRARIIRLAADGMRNQDVARAVGVSSPTVHLWRQRFLALRLPGLEKDAPRPGRPPRIGARKVRTVVEATLHTTPPRATHWSTRTMAKAQEVSEAAIRRIWKQHNLKPHRVETFQLSRDKRFIEKLHDVVALYLKPAGQGAGLVRGREEPDSGTGPDPTAAAAAFWDACPSDARLQTPWDDDPVRGAQYARRQSYWGLYAAPSPSGIYSFPETDRYGRPDRVGFAFDRGSLRNPPAPRVASWLKRHPRFHLHFIPTSSCWLNMVERWFREITDKRLRRGTFESERALIKAIMDYIDNHNQNPKAFVWTASTERIMKKIAKCKEVLGTLH